MCARRATFGQFHASIDPRMNQSVRWPFAASAQATYDVQLQENMPHRSTVSATPAAGHLVASG
jgi:hypothetical protein